MNAHPLAATLAPCGLDCGRCLARAGGPIATAAGSLLADLAGFERHAARFAGFDPVFARYDDFAAVAGKLAQASCHGCRSGECLYRGCAVQGCAAEHGVSWCFECAEFPCEKSGFPDPLKSRWLAANRRMAEAGVEAFYRESLAKPRY